MVNHKYNCLIGTVLLLALLPGLPSFAQVGTWTTKAPMPTARGSLASGVVNGRLYAIGGGIYVDPELALVESFDPQANSWEGKAPLPVPVSGAAAGAMNGTLIVVGGLTTDQFAGQLGDQILRLTQAYNPNTNTWSLKAPMPTARVSPAVAVLDGVMYAAGGWSAPPFRDLGTLEAYDPKTDSWTAKAAMPTPRQALVLVAFDHHLYAIGGEDHVGSTPRVLATVEAYDPQTDSWATRSPMPTPRGVMAAGVIDGMIYVAGGGDLAGALHTLEAYDPKTDSWTESPPMPTARGSVAYGVLDGALYVIGGQDSSGHALAVNEAFSPFETVSIDIKPGDAANTINLKSNGVMPVAILGSATFDPMTVDPSTVTFAGAPVATHGRNKPMTGQSDVNSDGYPDLVLYFRTNQLQLTPSSTEAVLYGTTYGGQRVRGSGTVRIVPPSNASPGASPAASPAVAPPHRGPQSQPGTATSKGNPPPHFVPRGRALRD